MVLIDMSNPRNARFVQMRTLIGRLSIEVKTGMKFRGFSNLQAARQLFGVKARTKKGALAELEAMIRKEYPEVYR